MQKKIVSAIYLKDGRAVTGRDDPELFWDGDAVKLAVHYSNAGADALLIFDLSQGDAQHEQSLGLIKEMSRLIDIPMYGMGNIRRVEDVKKLIYAGCRMAVLNGAKPSNLEMLEEVSGRFGKEKIGVSLAAGADTPDEAVRERIAQYAGEAVILSGPDFCRDVLRETKNPGWIPEKLPLVWMICGKEPLSEENRRQLFHLEQTMGLADERTQDPDTDLMGWKAELKADGIEVNTYESSLSWEEFKLNSDGLIPVVVQDYKTEEVLMVAYMNREAYETTVRSGRMTYWSRSRRELWIKGQTSGHFQYVKELRIDCDNDTILAKVAQVGAACHTGNRSCFYRTMLKKDYVERNPMKVFEEVYGVIEDRRLHPKEGSYTNYLFDKGIDKILKKVGEEATEIVIAAKNPNPEEVKYEISDFLYHVMVLMSERGVTWEDIAKELADR